MEKEKEKESMYYDDYKRFYEDIRLLERRFPYNFDKNIIIYLLIRLENMLVGLNNNLTAVLEELSPTQEEEEEEE